jgi:hypothetical protein
MYIHFGVIKIFPHLQVFKVLQVVGLFMTTATSFFMSATTALLGLLSASGIGASFVAEKEDIRRATQANGNVRGRPTGRTNLFDYFHAVDGRTPPQEEDSMKTMMDSKTVSFPHVSCAAFLKANHTAQDLQPVNFMANDMGEELAPQQAADADGFTVSSAQMTAISCIGGKADTGSISYPCSNIDLMSFIPLANMIIPNVPTSPQGNSIWGWTYNDGREFALMCLSTGTAFVEITDPVNPVYIGILPSHNLVYSPWRDVRTYANHAFIVSEAASHGMQVFDLTLLLNVDASSMPVRFTPTVRYTGFSTAHTIAINEATGFAYAVGSNTYAGGLHMINIRTPSNPVFAGGYGGDGYTHECQCALCEYPTVAFFVSVFFFWFHVVSNVPFCSADDSGPDTRYTGKEICFNYNEDTLTIVDVTNKAAPIQLSRIGYTASAFTHQGWLTDDRRHVIVDDELDEIMGTGNTKSHVFNVQSLTNPTYVGYHSGTTKATDHNLYIKGNLVFETNFRAGLQVLRIDNLDTASMTQVGYFDIYPSSDSNSLNGAWGNYPYFPSGNIIVSGIEQGLYVLKSPNNFGTSARPTNRPITSKPTSSKPTPPPSPTAIIVEAESYLWMQGVQTENTSDGGGGMNVGYIDTGDWMSYREVTITSTGAYRVEYRVACGSSGGILQLEKAGGTQVYGTVTIQNTGGWQNWQTVAHTVNLTAGPNAFGIKAIVGGWNINWFRITMISIPTTTEPTTHKPTLKPTTSKPRTTSKPTTLRPTLRPSLRPTNEPTKYEPSTIEPTTNQPTTNEPTTNQPTTNQPTTNEPTTNEPTTNEPTTSIPTTTKPTTHKPTSKPTTRKPTTTSKPTTRKPTSKPTTRKPTSKPTTRKPIL